jgi:alanine racemase
MPEEAHTVIAYDLQAAVSTMAFVEAISAAAVSSGKTARLHLFIETGMHREGILPCDAVAFLEKASTLPGIDFVGICTHFATSCTNPAYALGQFQRFNQTLEALAGSGFSFNLIHAANSGGLVNISTIPVQP